MRRYRSFLRSDKSISFYAVGYYADNAAVLQSIVPGVNQCLQISSYPTTSERCHDISTGCREKKEKKI